MNINNIDIINEDFVIEDNDDYSLHIVVSKKGDNVQNHFHSNWNETWIIIDGSFKCKINNDEYILNKNDIVTIPLMANHYIETLTEFAKRLCVFKKGVEISYVGT